MRILILVLAVLLPISSLADSALPFMKDLAGDTELPRPWGISLDFYTMDQDYDIKDLQFVLPGLSLGDPSQVDVTNEVVHFDRANLSLEYGFGNREHTLFNFNFRF